MRVANRRPVDGNAATADAPFEPDYSTHPTVVIANSKRRRWELKPLLRGCSPPPGRPAPASSWRAFYIRRLSPGHHDESCERVSKMENRRSRIAEFETSLFAILNPPSSILGHISPCRPRMYETHQYEHRRPHHSNTPPRNRTSSNGFEDRHASITPAGQLWFSNRETQEPTAGFAPA